MADNEFVTAVGPDGKKRRVPRHYLDNPALGAWKLPPSTRGKASTAKSPEPASPENKEARP